LYDHALTTVSIGIKKEHIGISCKCIDTIKKKKKKERESDNALDYHC